MPGQDNTLLENLSRAFGRDGHRALGGHAVESLAARVLYYFVVFVFFVFFIAINGGPAC